MASKNKGTICAKRFKQRRDSFQETALQRISGLFAQAESVFAEDSKLSDRYIFLARKLSLKYKVSFTKEQKMKFCRKCGSFLLNGKNARIRLSKGNLVLNCGVCKEIRRFRYK